MIFFFCFSAIERATIRYQTNNRDELLGHLWSEYGQSRAARAFDSSDSLSNHLLSMDDCEVFECGVASLGRKAYGVMRRLGTAAAK